MQGNLFWNARQAGRKATADSAPLPLEYVEGLVKAELMELWVPGEDTESDEALYDRYREKSPDP